MCKHLFVNSVHIYLCSTLSCFGYLWSQKFSIRNISKLMATPLFTGCNINATGAEVFIFELHIIKDRMRNLSCLLCVSNFGIVTTYSH